MRMSCNGCRVLRKGCSDNCSIRPCLEWIKNPESQANATVFLAKFYGRAGLMNLINAGPQHLRPALFRSLLYEACGRIVNPIYGSVGLVWSGSWQLCQAAVEAVLKGEPITPMATDVAETKNVAPPLKAYDIRHVNKDDDNNNNNASGSDDLHKVRNRCRFKRSGQQKSSKRSRVCADDHQDESGTVAPKETKMVIRSPSHDESSLSHQSHEAGELLDDKVESESLGSADTTEPPARELDHHDGEIIELELTLGFEPPAKRSEKPKTPVKGACGAANEDDGGFCKMELGLDYPAYAVMI